MSPTRRQILAAIAGAAAASTVGPASVLPLPARQSEPDEFEGMIVFRRTASRSEFSAKVRIEIDPEDGSAMVSIENVCDTTLTTSRLYEVDGSEALMTMLADGAELSRQYRARPDVIMRTNQRAAKEQAYHNERNAA